MRRKQAALILTLGLASASTGVPAQDNATAAGKLPNTARVAVHGAMTRHGFHASALTQAVILDDDRAVVQHATNLLEEARPALPVADEPEALNTQFPAEWFVLDARSRTAIEQLRSAARRHDDRATVASFAQVVETCRNCHRALRTRPAPAIPGQSPAPGLQH